MRARAYTFMFVCKIRSKRVERNDVGRSKLTLSLQYVQRITLGVRDHSSAKSHISPTCPLLYIINNVCLAGFYALSAYNHHSVFFTSFSFFLFY